MQTPFLGTKKETSSEFYGAQIAWNGDGWTLSFGDGRHFGFPEAYYSKSYAQGAPVEMTDANGHSIRLKRDKERNLEQLISISGRTITLQYDAANRITEAEDDTGNVRKYSYDSSGHLETVTDGARVLYRFEYAPLLHYPGYDSYLLMAVFDGRGNALLRNNYKRGGQVSEQRLANGEVYRYDYKFEKNEIVETIVNSSAGKRKFIFQHGIFAREE